MKKIDEWLNKLLGIGKGEDVERPVGNKDSVDRIRSMESNKEYINPNAIRTEIKKIDAWLNKLLGIGKGEDVERPAGNKDSFDRTRSMESYKKNINPNAIRTEIKRIDAWLKKFLSVEKREDVERLVDNKGGFDRTRPMEGNKEYIKPNAIGTEIKKIDAWLNKFLGIGKGEDVERFVCTKEGYDWTGRSLSSYQTYIDANAIKEGASIIIDHNKKTIRFMMLKS